MLVSKEEGEERRAKSKGRRAKKPATVGTQLCPWYPPVSGEDG